ncbi:hypothetical protein ACQKLP_15450 [Chitinophaga sp. NPDC101104]|uniref:hypothetical protein n=1 Tax=Chitinophaga sp. NPDC101104 TaxID=3390561 RepID=UPI003D08D467
MRDVNLSNLPIAAAPWKENASEVLYLLQQAYPDMDILLSAELEQLAEMRDDDDQEDAMDYLGQALSVYGYALYKIDSLQEENWYAILSTDEVPPEEAVYQVSEEEMDQEGIAEESRKTYGRREATLCKLFDHEWGDQF